MSGASLHIYIETEAQCIKQTFKLIAPTTPKQIYEPRHNIGRARLSVTSKAVLCGQSNINISQVFQLVLHSICPYFDPFGVKCRHIRSLSREYVMFISIAEKARLDSLIWCVVMLKGCRSLTVYCAPLSCGPCTREQCSWCVFSDKHGFLTVKLKWVCIT